MTLVSENPFFYKGVPRWDFGLDNPNKAAAILACLLILLLGLSLKSGKTGQTCFATLRRWGRWCCGALAAVVGFALVRTFSRGGLVAFLAGAVILLVGSWKKPCKLWRWFPALLAVLVIVGAALWTGFAGRMARSAPSADTSVGNRLVIWRNVPAMMVDAPGGWGRGNAGDVYMGWYQPLSNHLRYRTLVNSHFTWLVEMGWIGRIGYVCGLAFLFAMGIVRLRVRGDPIPLAVLTSFTTSAFFSSVAEERLVCVIPLILTLPAFKSFVFDATMRMRWISVAAALLVGCSLLGAAAVAGTACRSEDTIPLRKSPDGTRIVVGNGTPSSWVVCDPAAMGGPAFGRLLRGFAQTPEGRGPVYGLADDLATVPDDVRHLALCGKAANIKPDALSRFGALSDIRVIAPKKPQDWLAARAQMPCIRVFCGEFSESCPEDDVEGLNFVAGAADYIPDWPRLAFADVSP